MRISDWSSDVCSSDLHSQRQHPVMLHRAIVGSMERFIGILIENHAGQLPVWLAPVKAVVMNITDAHAPYADKVCKLLLGKGFRVYAELRKEKVGHKSRVHTLHREVGTEACRERAGQ